MNLLFTGFLRDEYVDEERDGDNQMEHKQRPSSSKPAQPLTQSVAQRSRNGFQAGVFNAKAKATK